MFGVSIDAEWVAIIAGFWLAFFVAFGVLIWTVGHVLARRDQRVTARRPLAPVVPLDLHRTRRSSARGGYIHHHGDIA